MGLYRMMCRGQILPWWRRKTTLLWALLVLGAVVYFLYSRSHPHKALTEIFMDSDADKQNNHVDSEGFWETNGGREIEKHRGRIKFLSRYKHKPKEEVEEPKVYDEEVEEDENIDNDFNKLREEERQGDEDVEYEEEENNEEGDKMEEQDREFERVEEGHRVKGDKMEEEDRVFERVEEGHQDEEGSRMDEHERGEGVEKHRERAELENNVKVDEKPMVGRDDVAREEENRRFKEHRNRIEVLNRKIELAKKPAQFENPRAGVVDAALPDKETLLSWDHDRLESTFHNYILVPQTECAIIARMGKKEHGGWDVCHADQYRPARPCLMYSFGFDTDYTFEDDVARRYGCETHYFDPKITYLNGKRRSSGVFMHSYALSSDNGRTPNGWEVRTLFAIKKELQHTQPIDILKVDIEENEWRALPEMVMSGVMGKVTQFLLEVHVLDQARTVPTKSDYIKYLTQLRDLYIEGFRIATSREDGSKISSLDGIMRSQNYEILFVRQKS